MTARTWGAEGALRMLDNNLDPEVAERPEDLVVYGGTGKAARDHASLAAIRRCLVDLAPDETLLVQSGRPVGVFTTHDWAPRVLLANSNLVGDWATWPEFRRLEHLGLTMYGQMTAGSWIYIGSQGILQGTYETFAAVARARGGSLAGTLTLTAGLGGMGGAQPLAVTMNGGTALVVEADPARARRRVETGYLDEIADDLDAALARVEAARSAHEAVSVGVIGNAAELLPAIRRRGAPVDVVTDQTSAHDPLSYLPVGVDLADWAEYARTKPEEFTDRARESMGAHVEAMLGFLDDGAEVFDYGNSIRAEARLAGVERAFEIPGFVPAYIRPQFCEGRGPVPVGGALRRPRRHRGHRPRGARPLRRRRAARALDAPGGGEGAPPGPARAHLLARLRRAPPRGGAVQRDGRVRRASAPVVIGRDHLDAGSVASPHRETEAMIDGSDAIADWPLLNALLNTASGASWVSLHHGGGVGIGRSIHAGQVCVADGSELAGRKIARVLTNDPGTGVIRHADAGYPRALEVADERGVRIPSERRSGRRRERSSPTSTTSAATPVAAAGRATSATTPSRPCGSGSPSRPGGVACRWRPTRTSTCGPGGATPRVTTPSSPAATSTPCPAAAPTTARSASSRRCAAVDALRARGVVPGTPARGGRLRRGGGRALRGAVPRLAAAHRLARPRPGARAARPRRRHARRGADRTRHTTRRALGTGAGATGPPRPFRRAARRAGTGARTARGRAWPSGRRSWRTAAGGSSFTGRADHAGTTRRADRRDPMIPASRRPCSPPAPRWRPTATTRAPPSGACTRCPAGPTSSPPAWTCGSTPAARSRRTLVDDVTAAARSAAEAEGVRRRGARASRCPARSPSTPRWPTTAAAVGPARPAWPPPPGHDAGVLAAHVPAGMLHVRNPTGSATRPTSTPRTPTSRSASGALADVLEACVADVWCEHAWLPGGPVDAVALDSSTAGSPRSRTGAPRDRRPCCPGSPSPGW